MTVLLTRPTPDSREIAVELARDGIDALIWPLTQIVSTGAAVELPPDADGLIVTSTNGLTAFVEGSPRRDLPVLAVGDRTARAARAAGFHAESAGGDARALAALAKGSGLRHLFHPRGRDSAAELPAMLAPFGVRVTEQVLYAAEPMGRPPAPVASAFQNGAISAVTFWSARNAHIFNDLWKSQPLGSLNGTTAIAISRRTAEALDGCPFGSILVSDRPDRQAMIGAIRTASAGRGQQT